MDGTEIETHCPQQVGSQFTFIIEIHLSQISGDPAEYKTVMDIEKRIRRAMFPLCQFKKSGRGGFFTVCPIPGRRNKRLCFPDQLSSAPLGNRHKARPSQAPPATTPGGEFDN